MDDDETTTTATVRTDRPGRYGKQLVSHLGRRSPGEWNDATGRGEIRFEHGVAALEAADGELRFVVRAASDIIGRLEDVVGRHLVRFATQDRLDVLWVRSDGTAGTRQTSEETGTESHQPGAV